MSTVDYILMIIYTEILTSYKVIKKHEQVTTRNYSKDYLKTDKAKKFLIVSF